MSTTAADLEAASERQADGWVAVVGADTSSRPRTAVDAAGPQGARFVLGSAAGQGAPDWARDSHRVVVLDGTLHNAHDLAAVFGVPQATRPAAIVLAGLRRLPLEQLARQLRGVFAVLVWNTGAGVLEAVRDQIGIHPLYWARTARGVAFSSSVDALLRQPGVSGDLDPVTLAEYLGGRFATSEETFYTHVRRCPPATVTCVERSGVRTRQYWTPLPPGEPVPWLDELEAEAFDGVFARAVERSVGSENAGVFLSGGLDSIAVGAVAADMARERGRGGPLALSLAFREPDCDERDLQRRVAGDLALDQVLLPFEQAVAPDRFIRTALHMGADWPFPMWNVWSPAYAALAAEARQRGCGVVLTGRGGDEWLTVSPYYAADLARRGDVLGLVHLLSSRNRSRRHTGLRYTWQLLVDRVARPLAGAALDTVAPAWWHRQRRVRMGARLAPWIAPDPRVRSAMDGRVDTFIDEARPAAGFYVREMLATLGHPCVTGDLEETHEFGRRIGVRQAHPYWDVDVVEFLCRMPPRLLDAGGRSKAPLRRMLARRFPGVGFERQKKAHALGFFASMMRREAPGLWAELDGLRTLHGLGVVDARRAKQQLLAGLDGSASWDPGRTLELMTLETWARHRMH